MKIKVTKDCITNAIRNNSHHCMIADAMHLADKDAKYVLVDLQSIRWTSLKTRKRYFALTPPKAQLKLLMYDMGKPVKPFSFTVHHAFTRNVGWHGDPAKLKRTRKRFATGESVKQTKRVVRPKIQREFGLRILTAK